MTDFCDGLHGCFKDDTAALIHIHMCELQETSTHDAFIHLHSDLNEGLVVSKYCISFCFSACVHIVPYFRFQRPTETMLSLWNCDENVTTLYQFIKLSFSLCLFIWTEELVNLFGTCCWICQIGSILSSQSLKPKHAWCCLFIWMSLV